MMLDEYGYDRRPGGLSFKVNITWLLNLIHSWRNRKVKKDAELDAENERLRASDAAWEALISKPSGDEDLDEFDLSMRDATWKSYNKLVHEGKIKPWVEDKKEIHECPVCGAVRGQQHDPYCSVGPDIFT